MITKKMNKEQQNTTTGDEYINGEKEEVVNDVNEQEYDNVDYSKYQRAW